MPTPAMPVGVPTLDLQDFLWKTHSYMNDYIRFADTKAAIVIALSTALLGGLITAEAHHWCSPRLLNFVEPAWKESWLGIGALLSILFLVLAFSCAIFAMTPRLWSVQITGLWQSIKHMFAVPKPSADHSAGFIFCGEILKHGSAENYWESGVREIKTTG